MARGDFVTVTYRTGAGTAEKKVQVTRAGGRLVWDPPRSSDRFMEVKVVDQNDSKVEVHLFASQEVVAVVEGHETIGTAVARKKK